MAGVVGAKAKRGDLVVQAKTTRHTGVAGGPVASGESTRYLLGIVTSVSRDGKVKEFQKLGEATVEKRELSGLMIVDKGRIPDMKALESAYLARGDWWHREFEALDDVKGFVGQFLEEQWEKRPVQGATKSIPTYRPELRPASFAAMPAGVTWEFIEAPWDLAHRRTDLPRSSNRHGLISTDRPLTDDECERFGLVRQGSVDVVAGVEAGEDEQEEQRGQGR